MKDRKRHPLVDMLGLLILLVVTAAHVIDYNGNLANSAQMQKRRQNFSGSCQSWVDGGYRGLDFLKWVMDSYRWILEIKRSDDFKGFILLPQRRVVERTFGWMMWNRRLGIND